MTQYEHAMQFNIFLVLFLYPFLWDRGRFQSLEPVCLFWEYYSFLKVSETFHFLFNFLIKLYLCVIYLPRVGRHIIHI